MSDEYRNASIRARQQNINRYCRLLATPLTSDEHQYIHRRIREERAELERLLKFEQSEAKADRIRSSTRTGFLIGDRTAPTS